MQCTGYLVAKAAGYASEALIYRVRGVDFHKDSFASSPFPFLIDPHLHYTLHGDSLPVLLLSFDKLLMLIRNKR